jgi:hypothetical protein
MNIQQATPRTIPTLDLAYFPKCERALQFWGEQLECGRDSS